MEDTDFDWKLINVALDRDKLRYLVYTLLNLQIPQNTENFIES